MERVNPVTSRVGLRAMGMERGLSQSQEELWKDKRRSDDSVKREDQAWDIHIVILF